ncbi:MAG TPA: ATP-binding protein [Pyrinomonadaceae bacterium]|nr:ATP-binding protein [Pyrinomonadaceae bacterium]
MLTGLGALLLVAALLWPGFYVRAAAAVAVLAIATVFITRRKRRIATSNDGEDNTASSDQTIELGKLFEATMTGMREGLLVVDKDMRVVASNPAAHRLFNLSRDKLNSQRLTDLTRNPAIYSAFLDALHGIERSGVKVETHGTDRSVFDLRAVPLESANGSAEPRGALGVFIDVTRIEQLERVRQEFLSNVSHELRTPLTAILAFVETLETTAGDDKESVQRFLSIIRRNAARMNTLIGDILELSAIEAGNIHVQPEIVELKAIVSDVVASLISKAADRYIIVTNAVPDDAKVYADAPRLEQMLTNLIDNAIKFNREHGTVTIAFESAETDRILVSDTGEGIPAQHLERLFERFYRVDRARSRELGGTGLGLAIVKHLARAHDGEVTVTSEVGKGSTFVIELPRK